MALKWTAVTLVCVVWAVADASTTLRRGLLDVVPQSSTQSWIDFAIDPASNSLLPQMHHGVRPAVAVDANVKPGVAESPLVTVMPFALPTPDLSHHQEQAVKMHAVFASQLAPTDAHADVNAGLNAHKIPEAVKANFVRHDGPTPAEKQTLLAAHAQVLKATAAVAASAAKGGVALESAVPEAAQARQLQQQAGTSTYSYSTSFQYYTVPAGVSTISITAVGGSGSSFTGDGGTGAGGLAAGVTTTCKTVPGTIIQISTGGAGKGLTPGSSPYNTAMASYGYGPGAPGSTDGAAGGAVTTVHACASKPAAGTACSAFLFAAGGGGGDCSLAKCFSGGSGGNYGVAGSGICSTSGGPNTYGSSKAYCNTNYGYSVGALVSTMIGGKGDGGSGGQGKYGGGGGQGLGGGGGGAFGSGGGGSSFSSAYTGSKALNCSSAPYYGAWGSAGDGVVYVVDTPGVAPTTAPTQAAGTVGSITTGYWSQLYFPPTDTTCSTTPVSAYYAPLGSCLSGVIYTADVRFVALAHVDHPCFDSRSALARVRARGRRMDPPTVPARAPALLRTRSGCPRPVRAMPAPAFCLILTRAASPPLRPAATTLNQCTMAPPRAGAPRACHMSCPCPRPVRARR